MSEFHNTTNNSFVVIWGFFKSKKQNKTFWLKWLFLYMYLKFDTIFVLFLEIISIFLALRPIVLLPFVCMCNNTPWFTLSWQTVVCPFPADPKFLKTWVAFYLFYFFYTQFCIFYTKLFKKKFSKHIVTVWKVDCVACTEGMCLPHTVSPRSFDDVTYPPRENYTAKLLFHQSPTRHSQWLHSDYHCDDVVTVL